MRATSSSSGNSRRNSLTWEQVQGKKDKAVRFLRDVVGDELVAHTDSTGDELADEIEAESVEAYADRKGITMANPLRTGREIIEHVLATYLPTDAAPEERRRAIAAAQKALGELSEDATEVDELEVVTLAVRPIADEVERRTKVEGFFAQRYFYLPSGCTDRDEAEWQRIVAGAVREMPADAPHFEADRRIREATAPLVRKIEARERRRSLIQHGKSYVSTYLAELWREATIDRQEYFDSERTAELQQAAAEELQDELSGEETHAEVEEIVRSAVDYELGIENDDEEEGDEEG